MNELLELIEEAKEWSGCKIEKEGKLYRIFKEEVQTIQSFINRIEMEGHRVFVHQGPEIIENTSFYGILAEVVHKDEVSEEESGEYTVICGVDYD